MEDNKQDYITIKFDLKAPKDYKQSVINTIVLILDNIRNLEEYKEWDNIDTIILNDNIERVKRELDSLKIIEYKQLEDK